MEMSMAKYSKQKKGRDNMEYKARIKFFDKEWLIIENIEYEGIKYYYIIEDISEKLEDIENIEDYEGNFSIEFIYKLENGNYRNVTDKELIEKLSSIVALKKMASEM